jgi:hypothetical protein
MFSSADAFAAACAAEHVQCACVRDPAGFGADVLVGADVGVEQIGAACGELQSEGAAGGAGGKDHLGHAQLVPQRVDEVDGVLS